MPAALTLYVLASALAVAPIASPSTPFVAGYERFFHQSDEQQKLGGELLISELSCTACHVAEDDRLQPKRGPRLAGVGLSAQREWLLNFLTSPQAVKPGTTMPSMLQNLSEEETDRTVRALAAYLSIQRKPFAELVSTAGNPIAFEFWKKGSVDRGRTLYHQVGCVACHEPDSDYAAAVNSTSDLEKLLAQLEPDEIRELGLENAARPVPSVPHGDLSAKYTRQSLTFFLLDPNETRPSGRMPSLKLKPDEAADITAYLLRDQESDSQSVEPVTNSDLVEEGRRLFFELRCVNCHDVGNAKPLVQAKPFDQLNFDATRSCVGKPQAGLPAFSLSDRQTRSLRSRLTLTRVPASDDVQLQMMQLNCYACHERDKQGGVGPNRRGYFETVSHVDLGDEGRLPPPLDGVGRKLAAPWFKQVLAGTGDVRPHMHARMPVFAKAQVASLPTFFAKADTANQTSNQEFQNLEDFGSLKTLAEAGRSLLDLGCVQCHPLRGEYLPGVVGVDLEGITTRVRPQWFRDFLLNPASLKSRTRMPTFFPNGRSGVPTILEGDVEHQIAAIWTYLSDIQRQPLPDKIESSKVHNFELIPEDRPILLRTFMLGAGTHAIAVGFPQKVHFAFDAESVRLAQAWRGRFVDAHGTWFDRFTPPAVPLGDDLVTFPAGVPLALLPQPDSNWPADSTTSEGYRFRGYRLDEAGVPTFLYDYDRFRIEDRVEPTSDGQLTRQLQIREIAPSDDQRTLWFRANVGKSLRLLNRSSYVNEAGLTTTLSNDDAQRGTVVNGTDGVPAWLIPLVLRPTATMEVQYKW